MGNQIYIAKDQLTPGLQNRLVRVAAFQNPEFYKAQAMRLPTFDKPRVIACAEDHPQHIGLPRGCFDEVQALLSDLKIGFAVRDERSPGRPLEIEFQGQLHSDQETAAKAMLAHDTGVLFAAAAFGKTVVAAWLIAQRRVNTLVVVHRRQLMEQWVQRLATFLNLSSKEIGQIGGGRRKPTGLLDVALVQSLSRKGGVHDLVRNYGHLVVDECHHLPATSFEQVVRQAKAKFVTGLSATVTRKDGHHPIVFMQCGPHFRPPLPRLRGGRLQDSPSGQCRAGLAHRRPLACRPRSGKTTTPPAGSREEALPPEDRRSEELCRNREAGDGI